MCSRLQVYPARVKRALLWLERTVCVKGEARFLSGALRPKGRVGEALRGSVGRVGEAALGAMHPTPDSWMVPGIEWEKSL